MTTPPPAQVCGRRQNSNEPLPRPPSWCSHAVSAGGLPSPTQRPRVGGWWIYIFRTTEWGRDLNSSSATRAVRRTVGWRTDDFHPCSEAIDEFPIAELSRLGAVPKSSK